MILQHRAKNQKRRCRSQKQEGSFSPPCERNQNMKTRKFTGRIATLTLAILLLLTTLVGCAGKKVTPTLPMDEGVFIVNDDVMGSHAMGIADLRNIATLIRDAYSVGYDGREALVAATRGFDMTKDLSAVTDFSDQGFLNVEAVKNIVVKANTVLAEAGKEGLTNDQVEQIFAKWAETDENKDVIDAKRKADVNLILSAFTQKLDIQKGNFLDSVLVVIGKILNWITTYLGFGSYVVGICLFAIVIELIMLPFSIKQQKNSIKQAKLRPKEMAIKNKYKGRNDQPTMQKMQGEIQELYQRENFSPYSGCLPLLLQMPIIMALYYIVIDPLHYVLGQGANVTAALTTFATASPAAGGLGMNIASNRGTIELLSLLRESGDNIVDALGNFQYFTFSEEALVSLDKAVGMIPNFNIGSLNFGLTPSWGNLILMLVPVLTFLTYFFSSKLNRKFMYQPATNEGIDARQQACSNTMMDVTMPAMSAFFTMAVPAVIGVYWAFRSWVGLLKSFIMSRIMPLPKFTEEDYKAAEREMAGKTQKKINKPKSSGEVRAVRSLHYIDDEDFEDTRERGLARKAALEEKEQQEKAEAAERAQKLPFGKALLKKDDRKNENTEETSEDKTNTEDTTNNE